MKTNCDSFKVFDFDEDDELCETKAARLMSKFKNPKSLDKYTFLQSFAGGTKIRSEDANAQCVDVDAIYSDHNCDDNVVNDSERRRISGLDDVPQYNSTDGEQDCELILRPAQPGSSAIRASTPQAASPEKSESNCAKFPSSDVLADVIAHGDESMKDGSPSTSSNVVDDSASSDGLSSDHCHDSWHMGDRSTTVSICPDYIEYHDKYYTESVLYFSSSCISMKCSSALENHGTFSFQWGLDDISDIETMWFGRHGMTMVKIHILLKDGVQARNEDEPGIEELKFAVVDANWYDKQEEIISLDVKYNTLWHVVYDADLARYGEALIGQSEKSYFPNFDEPFEEVVYPKGDSDAVSISKRDVDLLQPETFVNDTIIDFYIKYLKNKIQPEERHRFHFFNSFFFRKLADLDKDPSSACQGKAAFQRVRKWTRKVNLFEKDYVFIPVNFNYHWSLIIICHPGEVAKPQDDVEKAHKVPCILHMDSIKGSHSGLKDLVQSYLWEEWKEKQKGTFEDISSKFMNLRFVPLELPQQQNSYDCGLFLLHYVELFLEEAPVSFSPFNITKFSKFLHVDWFPPAEASIKRVLIQRLIYELLQNHARENSPVAHGEMDFYSNRRVSDRNGTGMEFLSEGCRPKSCDGSLLGSQAGEGIEISLLPASSLRSAQCAGDSGLVLRELFESGVSAGSFIDGQYQAFDRSASFNEFNNAISAIEADEAGGQQYPSISETGYHRGPFSYPSRDIEAETWTQEFSVRQGHEDIDSSPQTSVYASDGSLEVEVNNNTPVKEHNDFEGVVDRERSPLTENIDCSTEGIDCASEMLDVPDSQNSDHMVDSNCDDEPFESCKSDLPDMTQEEADMPENRDGDCDDVQLPDDNPSGAEAEFPPAKRLRPSPSLEEQVKLASNLSEDLHL